MGEFFFFFFFHFGSRQMQDSFKHDFHFFLFHTAHSPLVMGSNFPFLSSIKRAYEYYCIDWLHRRLLYNNM